MTTISPPNASILRHTPKQKGVRIYVLLANAMFFAFGTAAWVFKIGDEQTGTILPYSFTQIFLPLIGIFSLILLFQVWRLRFPSVVIQAWSMRIVNGGIILILIGLFIQFAINSEYRLGALLVMAKWILPWCGLSLLFTGRLFGGKINWLVYGILFGCVLSVICVEANRVGVPIPIAKMTPTRVSGLLSNPNQYGILLSSLSPLIVYILNERGLINRVIGLGSIFFFAVGLFECLSKTNIIIWPIAMALTLFAYSCTEVKKLLRSVVLVALCAFVAVSLLGSALAVLQSMGGKDSEGMSQFFADPTSMHSLDDRQDAWDEVFQYLRVSPWLGEGPGWSFDHLMFLHAHNLFLQVWIEVGILGLLGAVFIAIGILMRTGEVLYSVFTHRIPLDSDARLKIAATIGLIASLFGNSMSASLLVETMVPFCLLLALAFSNLKIQPLVLGRPKRV